MEHTEKPARNADEPDIQIQLPLSQKETHRRFRKAILILIAFIVISLASVLLFLRLWAYVQSLFDGGIVYQGKSLLKQYIRPVSYPARYI